MSDNENHARGLAEFLSTGYPRDAVVWFPTGILATAQGGVRDGQDLKEFLEVQRDHWARQLESVEAIEREGWNTGSIPMYGYAIAPEATDLNVASKTVAQTIGPGTPVEFSTGHFRCGGCFAGEHVDQPNPFPLWLAADRIGKNVRVPSPTEFASCLQFLGELGPYDTGQVGQSIASGRWSEPGIIEDLAGIGRVTAVPDEWLRWLGRVDGRQGNPNMGLTVGGSFNPVRYMTGPLGVWLDAARQECRELPDAFDFVFEECQKIEDEMRPVKAPKSEEQLSDELRRLLDGADEVGPAALPDDGPENLPPAA